MGSLENPERIFFLRVGEFFEGHPDALEPGEDLIGGLVQPFGRRQGGIFLFLDARLQAGPGLNHFFLQLAGFNGDHHRFRIEPIEQRKFLLIDQPRQRLHSHEIAPVPECLGPAFHARFATLSIGSFQDRNQPVQIFPGQGKLAEGRDLE